MISTEGIAEEWVARLRSGKYTKGTILMKAEDRWPSGVRHCAQDLLAEIFVERGIFTQTRMTHGVWQFAYTQEAIEKFGLSKEAAEVFTTCLPGSAFTKVLANERMYSVDISPEDVYGDLGAQQLLNGMSGTREMAVWWANDHGMSWDRMADSLQKRMVKA